MSPRPQERRVTPLVDVTEYGGTAQIDSASAIIRGRYPDTGSGVNRESDMIIRVTGGIGVIAVGAVRHEVAAGSVVVVEHGTPYSYEPVSDALVVFMVSSPAWSADQYDHIA